MFYSQQESEAWTQTRQYPKTSWSSVPWNSKCPARNPTWGNRPPPWKGRRVWISPQSEHGRGWQTDWVSATFQWSQPSTLPSAHAPLCTHTHMHHLFTLFFLLLTHTVLYTGVLGLCCPLYPNKTLPITNHKYILHSQSCAHTHCLFNTHHSFHKCLNLIATIQM